MVPCGLFAKFDGGGLCGGGGTVVTAVAATANGAPPRVNRQNKSAHRSACAFAVPYGTEVYEKGENECKVEGGKQKTMRYC